MSLDGSTIDVQGSGEALVKLNCLGIAECHGKLTLTASVPAKASGGVHGKSKGNAKKATVAAATIATTTTTTTIGTVSFSIAGDETKTVKVDLNAVGRALLVADHGRCSASLALLELAPGAANTQTKTVRLVQQKSHGKPKK